MINSGIVNVIINVIVISDNLLRAIVHNRHHRIRPNHDHLEDDGFVVAIVFCEPRQRFFPLGFWTTSRCGDVQDRVVL